MADKKNDDSKEYGELGGSDPSLEGVASDSEESLESLSVLPLSFIMSDEVLEHYFRQFFQQYFAEQTKEMGDVELQRFFWRQFGRTVLLILAQQIQSAHAGQQQSAHAAGQQILLPRNLDSPESNNTHQEDRYKRRRSKSKTGYFTKKEKHRRLEICAPDMGHFYNRIFPKDTTAEEASGRDLSLSADRFRQLLSSLLPYDTSWADEHVIDQFTKDYGKDVAIFVEQQLFKSRDNKYVRGLLGTGSEKLWAEWLKWMLKKRKKEVGGEGNAKLSYSKPPEGGSPPPGAGGSSSTVEAI